MSELDILMIFSDIYYSPSSLLDMLVLIYRNIPENLENLENKNLEYDNKEWVPKICITQF